MVITAVFLVAVAALLAAIGRAVVRPGPRPDVEPRLAQDAAAGVDVLRRAGLEHARRLDRYAGELHGRSLPTA